MIGIRARNNLQIPIRLTLTNTNVGAPEILITVGKRGAALKTFYGVCIDTDLLPNEEWEDIGSLDIKGEYRISIRGEE